MGDFMQKFMYLTFVVFFLICANVQADWLVNCKGRQITLFTPNGNLNAEKKVFIDSFSEAYKNIPLDVLKVESLPKFLNAAFEEEENDFASKKANTVFISAKNENAKVVGFVSFANNSDHVYIRSLAVDPEFRGCGLGKALVFCVLNVFKNCRCLKLMTRKVNSLARCFYTKIGFSESAYIHQGITPERYIGYEYSFDDSFVDQVLSKYEGI